MVLIFGILSCRSGREKMKVREPGTIMSKSRQAEVLLILVTVVWGLTFALVKKSLETITPFVFMAWRFNLAFLVMGLLSARRLRQIDWSMVRAGLLLGVFLYASYSFQTFGLKYTTAGNAGFITGLFVIFVPILSFAVLRKKPDRRSIFAAIIAAIGLGFLSLQSNFQINLGDLLVLACSFSYSLHIIYLDRYARRFDLVLLTFLQMGFLAFGHTTSGLLFESFTFPRDGFVWMTIIVCGLFASALAFYIQAFAQRVLSPVRTSVVLIMEPVFSVLFGILLLAERLSLRGWVGCGLILVGMLISEVRPESAREAENLAPGS
jgi:drug/metabolite transporter (DMT)-like permease